MPVDNEKYPSLRKLYANYNNFEAIIVAIERYFNDIFQLDVLEEMASQLKHLETRAGQPLTGADGSYLHLFDTCMQQLRSPDVIVDPEADLSVPERVVKKLDDTLRSKSEVTEQLFERFIFKPGQQLGVMEKIATGELKVGEPLSYLDMRRAVYGLKHLKNRSRGWFSSSSTSTFPPVEVVQLKNLPHLNADQLYRSNTVLLINFNLDPKRKPKWGVLDLQDKANPRVYCEMPLREDEKKQMEQAFKLRPTQINYLPPKSNSPASTGYSAIAWLSSDEIPTAKGWNFDVNAEFSATFVDFMFVQWGGDGNPFTFRNEPGERKYMTPAFKRIATGIYEGSSQGENSFTGGSTSTYLCDAASLGELAGHSFTPGDLTTVINLTEEEQLSKYMMTKKYRYLALRALMPAFHSTLEHYVVQDKAADKNTLTIPKTISYDTLESNHSTACNKTGTNSRLLSLTRSELDNTELHLAALPTTAQECAKYMYNYVWDGAQKRLVYVESLNPDLVREVKWTSSYAKTSFEESLKNKCKSATDSNSSRSTRLELIGDEAVELLEFIKLFDQQDCRMICNKLHTLNTNTMLHLIPMPTGTALPYANSLIWDEAAHQFAYVDQDGHIKTASTRYLDYASKQKLIHLKSRCVRTLSLDSDEANDLINSPTGFKPTKRYPSNEAYAAALLVLGMVRYQAKKSILSISLAKEFELNPTDEAFIISLLKENAHVTELRINESNDPQYNNQSLLRVQQALLPILARNRWLKANGYLPPMVDNYWKQAAFYWLTYLHQEPEVLALENQTAKNTLFKNCVQEMGLQGLQAVLEYLSDPTDAETIKNIYGINKPAFYLACQPKEFAACLTTLFDYLEEETAYFPFNELGIAYQPGNDADLAQLIGRINALGFFEKLILTDCVKHKIDLAAFLQLLTEKAQNELWIGAISIPELEDIDNVTPDLIPLHALYTGLNNIITMNRHKITAPPIIDSLRKSSDFDLGPSVPSTPAPGVGPAIVDPVKKLKKSTLQNGPWPMERGGAVQLQVQQQQQIQQEFQMQQEQQRVVINRVEEAIVGPVITYDNIDQLLKKHFDQFVEENLQSAHPFNAGSATLWDGSEPILKGLFRTWTSAKPNSNAPHVIQQMTLDAAKELLRKHRRLASGLNPDNLPKGFYTQRSKDGQLILCFNPTQGFMRTPNELTLDLEIRWPKAEAWEGDFRFFNAQRYIDNPYQGNNLQLLDWNYIQLFAMLQPENEMEDDKQAAAFISRYKMQLGITSDQETKLSKYWKVFWQVWQFAGIEGFKQFMKFNLTTNRLLTEEARDLLCQTLPADLKGWLATIPMDEAYLRALGQIYFQRGPQVMELFIRKLRQIELTFKTLDPGFFNEFNKKVIGCNPNFMTYYANNGRFFIAMDAMMKALKDPKQRGTLAVWKKISAMHMEMAGWDSIEKLWGAFAYFTAQLKEMDLQLEGDEFDGIREANLFVLLDRVLTCLQQIPDLELKKEFLRHFKSYDLTHGGVYYAIKHEDFKYFDDELQLCNFELGTPTYRPELQHIYDVNQWKPATAPLQMKRALASQTGFDHESYKILKQALGAANNENKDLLILLIYTQYPAGQMPQTLTDMKKLNSGFRDKIAKALHKAAYQQQYPKVMVTLTALQTLDDYLLRHLSHRFDAVLQKSPRATVLEALTILNLTGTWDSSAGKITAAEKVFALFEANIAKPNALYSDALYWDAYKLVTLFGDGEVSALQAFYQESSKLPLNRRLELERLMAQVLSIDYAKSNLNAIKPPHQAEIWQAVMQCVISMVQPSVDPAAERIELLTELGSRGLRFKYSKSGDFRAIESTDPKPAEMGSFRDHETRLWAFFKDHIVVPSAPPVGESLKSLIRFFQGLQAMPRRYLNEIEPLLATLEKTPPGHYWSAQYFYGLLMALQVPDQSFPISLLSMIVQEAAIAAKPLDDVAVEFPSLLRDILQTILKSTFSRPQKALLCKIATMEYGKNGNNQILLQIMTTFSQNMYLPSDPTDEWERFNGPRINESYMASVQYALDILVKSKDCVELEGRFEICCSLMQHAGQECDPLLKRNWSKTTQFWLQALSMKQSESLDELRRFIQNQYRTDPDKQAYLLHIVAWSTLAPELQFSHEDSQFKLNRKVRKVIERLAELDLENLKLLAACYPEQPSPQTDDIARLLKRNKEGQPWQACLDAFERHPYPEPRADFAEIAASREADIQRMIAETRISAANPRQPLPSETVVRLTSIFTYLKSLEQGEITVTGFNVAIADMSKAELAKAFKQLAYQSITAPDNNLLQAQLWAVLFEVLGRTTRKYPHLAQQFALITNDIGITGCSSRVLQLATGEGKSHFVALRAAKHAGQGKIVDICTAKRVLAERDLQDYNDLFSYLGLKAVNVDPKTSLKTYCDAQIHYSTTGDMSLFLDEQSFNGRELTEVQGLYGPIEVKRENRVALFDEFDFIRFDEGRKTEYNYARPTGKTPKQMMWLYQAINEFYRTECLDEDGHLKGTLGEEITKDLVDQFIVFLQKEADDNPDRLLILDPIINDRLQAVQWIQSSHQAHKLRWRMDFTVREENIQVGDESYPMREIIPLSQDNQKMIGSTFSAGVQQLLAVRLNTEAKLGLLKEQGYIADCSQNFHVHPESNILSSQVAAQRMKQLWSEWEGFSGTISSAQAATLNMELGTKVLHVPTNQRDLRFWHAPKCYKNPNDRYQALVAQIRQCLHEKKSILFACKNDQQVADLEKALNALLTKDELKNFIFYTNEDRRAADKVLKDKEQQEKWHGGQKQQGVALVASGFGRGDNVGVEAVFLLDVSDTNDKLQKGGRTARNGAEGEVFQFYMEKDLRTEMQRCTDSLNAMGVDDPYPLVIWPADDDVDAERKKQIFLEHLMLKREYEFNLQNIANQGYHEMFAQFSAWGMAFFATHGELDLETKEKLIRAFSTRMQMIEKDWLNFSAQNSTDEHKIHSISQFIGAMADSFKKYADEVLGESIIEFQPVEYQIPHIECGQYQIPQPPDAKLTALSAICKTYMRLADVKRIGTKRLTKVTTQMSQLALSDNAALLQGFAEKIVHCQTIEAFERTLAVDLSKLGGTSSATLDESNRKEYTNYKKLAKALKTPTNQRLNKAFDHLMEPLRAQLIAQLPQRDNLAAEERVQAALPVMEYLGTFSPEQQLAWGQDYLQSLKTVFRGELTPDSLSQRLQVTTPMSLTQLQSLWTLAQRASDTELEFNELLLVIEKSLRGATEQRLRLLTQQAAWARNLPHHEARQLLIHFCQSIEVFKEGANWDVLTQLVKQTQLWWNKGGQQQYQAELLQFWQGLSAKAAVIPKLTSLLAKSLKFSGKSWFQVLNICFQLPDEALVAHHQQLAELWEALASKANVKKREKTAQFAACVKGFVDFYQLIASLDLDTQKQLTTLVLHLPGSKLQYLMQCIHENQHKLASTPQILLTMLQLYHTPIVDADKSAKSEAEFCRLACVNHAVLQGVIAHQEHHLALDKVTYGMQVLSHLIKQRGDISADELAEFQSYLEHNPVILAEPQAVKLLHEYVSQGLPANTYTPWIDLMAKAWHLYHQHPEWGEPGIATLQGVVELYKNTYFGVLSEAQLVSMQALIFEHVELVLQYPTQYKAILVGLPVILQKITPANYALELCALLFEVQAHAPQQDATSTLNQMMSHTHLWSSLEPAAFNYLVQQIKAQHHLLLKDSDTITTLLRFGQKPTPAESRLATVIQLFSEANQYWVEHEDKNVTPVLQFVQKNQVQMLGLNDEHFYPFMLLMQNNVMRLLERSDIYSPTFKVILSIINTRTKPLIELLITAAEREMTVGGKTSAAPVRAFVLKQSAALLSLPAQNLETVITLLLDHQKDIVDHASAYIPVMERLIAYQQQLKAKPDLLAILSELLLKIAAYQVRNPQVAMDDLLLAVTRFNDNPAVLQRLTHLVENDEQYETMDLLFNDLESYLDSSLLDKASPPVRKVNVAQTFFTLADATKTVRQQPQKRFEMNSEFRKLFNFNDLELRNNRLMMMRALYQKIQNTAKDKSQGELDGLTYGFERYVAHAQHILDKPSKAHVQKQRDLNVVQQIHLLSLTDELEFIVGTKEQPTQKPQEKKLKLLKKDMSGIVSQYRNAWFKSAEREEQLLQLQQALEAKPTEGLNDYQSMLERLHELKHAALAKDNEINRERWLKMNWSGQSRYLNTLNQLEDMVVRAWATDPQAVNSFHTYYVHYRNTFDDLVAHVKGTVLEELDELKSQPKWSKNLGAFYAYEHHPVYKVYAAMSAFDAHDKDGLNTQRLMQNLRLQRETGKLPRSLVTLVDQVLIQGDALAVHLYNQEKRGHRKG